MYVVKPTGRIRNVKKALIGYWYEKEYVEIATEICNQDYDWVQTWTFFRPKGTEC